MLKLLGKFLLWLAGWKMYGHIPQTLKKTVMIAAPHTSNWDFYYTICIFKAQGIKLRFLAKDSLFKFPMGILMRFFGGIPVDRSKRNDLVADAANLLKNADELVLLVAAEGTRGVAKEWKSGFYHIAEQAGVPISLGFLDYKKKEGGFFAESFMPTGNYEADLIKIKTIYKDVTPKYPKLSSLYQWQAAF